MKNWMAAGRAGAQRRLFRLTRLRQQDGREALLTATSATPDATNPVPFRGYRLSCDDALVRRSPQR